MFKLLLLNKSSKHVHKLVSLNQLINSIPKEYILEIPVPQTICHFPKRTQHILNENELHTTYILN